MDNLGISEVEDLQIEALKRGATPEEASLYGKLPRIEEAPQISPGASDVDVGTAEVVDLFEEGPSTGLPEDMNVIDEVDAVTSRASFISYEPINVDKKALELTMIRSLGDPTKDVRELYMSSRRELEQSYNPEAVMEAYQQEQVERKRQYLADSSIERSAFSGASPEQALEDLDIANEIADEYEGPIGRERLLHEGFADLSMEEFELQEKIAKDYSWKTYNQWAESLGLFEKGVNWASAIFIPDNIKDLSDLTGTGVFSAKEDLLKIITAYNSLDPRDKPEAFNEIFMAAIDAYEGNHVKLMGLVQTLNSYTPKEELNLVAAGDVFDILTLGADVGVSALVKSVKGLNRARSVEKTLRDVGAKTEAAIASEAPDATKDVADIATTSSPFNMEEFLPFMGSTDNLSKELLELRRITAEDVAQVGSKVDEIKNKDFLIKIGHMSPEAQDRVIKAKIEQITQEAEFQNAVFNFIEPVKVTDEGFTMRYTWEMPGGQKYNVTEERNWKLSDVGTLIEDNPNFSPASAKVIALRNALSPDVKLKNLTPNLVQDLTDAGMQSSRIRNELVRAFKSLNEGLSKKEILSADTLMDAGDQARKVFSLEELKITGVDTAEGFRTYTDNEVRAYYRKLAFNKQLHGFANNDLRRKLDFVGAKHIKIYPEVDGSKVYKDMFGIPKENWAGLPSDIDKQKVFVPGLTKGNDVHPYKSLDIEKLKEDGYLPVELITRFKNEKGESAAWALIKPNHTGDYKKLPDQVLNENPWYVMRSYKQGYYYVKDTKTRETVGVFERKKDADAWALNQNELNAVDESSTAGLYKSFRDRELSTIDMLAEEANSYGGLIYGSRKSTELTLNGGKDALQRAPYGDAMQKYIERISETMPLVEYRMALKQKFINTVNQLAKAEGLDYGLNPSADWLTSPILIGDTQMRESMNLLREYLKQQFRSWSVDEKRWHNYMMSMAEMMEGKFGKLGNKAADRLVNIAHKDPVVAMRSATFGAHLGWFNPRQIYVQAQNASLAISMYPKHGVSSVNDMFKMMPLARITSDEALEAIKTKNMFGLGDMVDEYRELKRSGLVDSILRNADYDAMKEGLTPGTVSSVKGLYQAGLIPYEVGELSSRMVAWGVAKRNLGLQGKRLTDSEIRDTLRETFRLHMNLQRENAAWWQTNALSIPMQFTQVQAKLIENVVRGLAGKDGAWTRGEAGAVLAGQILLYGTLGVPMAEGMVEYLSDKAGMSPEELQKTHPNISEFLSDGINGLLFQTLGFDNQFGGDTASLLAGLDNNTVADLIKMSYATFSGEFTSETFGDVVLGPTGSTLKRTYDGAIDTVNTLRALAHRPTFEQVGHGIIGVADDIASMTSTWSNARKAYFLYNTKQIMSKQGNVIIGEQNLSGLDLFDIIGQGMGFTADVEASFWALKKTNRENAKYLSDIKKDVKRITLDFISPGPHEGNYSRFSNLLYLFTSSLDPQEYNDMMKEISKDITSDKFESELDKEVNKYLMQRMKSGGRIHGQLENANIIQAGKAKEE